jgi:putative Holliday junction resolvase
MSRILAVDPGDVRIGLALSDPSRTIASPLSTLKHVSRQVDAERIAEIASQKEVGLILIGVPLNREGKIGPQARKSLRLMEAIQAVTSIPVASWDETGSTEMAREVGSDQSPLDARAAAVFLQEYLHANSC